ncbi:MAG: ImmA/IrrE family metallo-endopeptidase [Acidimicrobiia bacterium]|nr:ImmA/IrrE family metallo-endopeptidase [Acidimicrobiia bacterium]
MMADRYERAYEPAELVPPGETLWEWITREDMTQVEFARRAGLTPKHITHVIKGKVGISPVVALAFERVTSIPARYWTQLDSNYQTAKHRHVETQALRGRVHLVDQFPIKDLEQRGCIQRGKPKVDTLRELLSFFSVADPDALEEVWLRPALYRRSPAFEADAGALASWLRLAEIEAGRVKTASYDAAAVRDALDQMRALSRSPGTDWIEPLRTLCASVGIALVIVKELPRCRVNGATRWLSPEKAMIALSLRHRRNDIFWFTLFHELYHLLRHSKKETFVDAKGSGIDEDLEGAADSFAGRVLIPSRFASHLSGLTTEAAVEEFAEAIGVAPGIVVGRMQHDKLIPHSQWAHLIVRYRFDDDR